jgi:DNA-binding MarR family transcriptional regulator
VFLLDLHRLGGVASQLLRAICDSFEVNETQLLIILFLHEASPETARGSGRLAPIDLAKRVVCPLTTVSTQCGKLIVRGLLARVPKTPIREYSMSGRQLFELTASGLDLAARLQLAVEQVDKVVCGAIHRQSDSGVRDLSALFHEWSTAGVLSSPSDLAEALKNGAVRTPRRRR